MRTKNSCFTVSFHPIVYKIRVALNTTNHHKTHHKTPQTKTNHHKPLKPNLIVGYTCSELNWGRKLRRWSTGMQKLYVYLEKDICTCTNIAIVKSNNFCYFPSNQKMFQINQIKIIIFSFLKIEVIFILIFSLLRPYYCEKKIL